MFLLIFTVSPYFVATKYRPLIGFLKFNQIYSAMGKEWENRLSDYELRSFLLNMMTELKREIVDEVKHLMKQGQAPDLKKWVKSVDVKKLLNVSHGKLQAMRNSKMIAFTRIGGTIYYNVDDIQRMLENSTKK